MPPAAGAVAVQPAGAVNETNVVFAGTSSVSETFWAASGPAFVTVNVYVRSWPIVTGLGETDPAADTSALAGMVVAGVTVMLSGAASLLAEFGSPSSPDTLALLVIVPGCDAVKRMRTWTLVPEATVPRS